MKQGMGRLKPIAVIRRSRAAWARVAPFLGVSRWKIIALAGGSISAGVVEAAILALIAAIATALSAGESSIDVDLGVISLDTSLTTLFMIGFGLVVVRTALQTVMVYLPAVMSAGVVASLRTTLFDSFTRTAWRVQASERDGHFQSLIGGHVSSASNGIVTVGQAMSSFFMFFTLLLAALALSLPTAILLMILSSSLFLLMRPLSRQTRKYSKMLSEEQMEYSKSMQEVVRLAEENQVYGPTPSFRDEIRRRIDDVRYPQTRSKFFSGLVTVVYQSVALLVLLVALAVVSRLDATGLTSLTAVVLILVRSLTYGQQLQGALTRMQELAPFMDRLRDGIDNYLTNPRQDGGRPMPAVRVLAMHDVHFAYGSEPVLDGFGFEVHAGEAIGIVGPSGAGKSTLVQLLLRLRQPDSGSFSVNGIDTLEISRAQWQHQVAYVPQSPMLMWGTVADNIRFHRPDVSHEDVVRAARLASIHDEIETWAQGYDTIIGERASAVSGGQRQRLCLARALAARPSVLVLDEPTSALDVHSELLIQDALNSLKGEMTLFLVAHRLSTLSICNRVMVVVGGKLQSIDTPERLLTSNEFYRRAIEITREQSRV